MCECQTSGAKGCFPHLPCTLKLLTIRSVEGLVIVDNGIVEGGGWIRGCVRECVDNGIVEGGGWIRVCV